MCTQSFGILFVFEIIECLFNSILGSVDLKDLAAGEVHLISHDCQIASVVAFGILKGFFLVGVGLLLNTIDGLNIHVEILCIKSGMCIIPVSCIELPETFSKLHVQLHSSLAYIFVV